MDFTTNKGNMYHLINQIIKKDSHLPKKRKKNFRYQKKGSSMLNETLQCKVWGKLLGTPGVP